MPAGFTAGKAHGRLSDGRILGQLRNADGWHIAIWGTTSEVPTTTFFGTRGQIEAPALGALDVLLITENSSPNQTFTWSEAEGKQEISSQVNGGLPTYRKADFVGDGGHLIVTTLDGGAKTWLLTPVPEPGTWIALGVGPLALLLRLRTRKKEAERG